MISGLLRWNLHDVSTKITVLEAPPLNFPSVTICNYNLVSKAMALQDESTATIIGVLNGLGDITSQDLLNNPQLRSIVFTESLYNFSLRTTPSLEDCILNCSWKGVQIADCAEYFYQTLTSWGFCFTFNSVLFQNANNYRFNVSRTGTTQGLWVQLNAKQDDYYLQQIGTSSAGYKVVVVVVIFYSKPVKGNPIFNLIRKFKLKS